MTQPMTPESLAEIRRNLAVSDDLPPIWRRQIERLCAEVERLRREQERNVT